MLAPLDFQEHVTEHLHTLFQEVLAGGDVDATPAPQDVESPLWSRKLQKDLIRAAKILSAAWNFRGA